MIHKKLATLAAATVIGGAPIAAPAQAQFAGFGGMRGGGFAVGHVGGFGSLRGGPVFVGRSAFVNRGFFANRRFAFFPHRRFVAPFFGISYQHSMPMALHTRRAGHGYQRISTGDKSGCAIGPTASVTTTTGRLVTSEH